MEITRIERTAFWTPVMLNITFADIIDGCFGFPVTSKSLLFSVLTEVPMVMIFLSLVMTTLFVVGSGNASPAATKGML
jgi:hypothetical protein